MKKKYNCKEYSVVDPNTEKTITGTIAELSKYFGLKRNTVDYRVKNMGMSLDDALKTPVKQIYTIQGCTGTLPELCEKFDTNMQRVRRRMKEMGMTLEEALTTPKHESTILLVKDPDTNKVVSGTKKSLAEYFGTSRNAVDYRLKQGMTIEKALSIGGRKRISKTYTVKNPYTNEEIVGTKYQISKQLNIPYNTITYRMNQGLTFEKAVLISIKKRKKKE